MSSWIVTKPHIDLLITAGLILPSRCLRDSKLEWETQGRRYELDEVNADDVGVTLWAENYASVNHQYPHAGGDLPGPADFDGPDVLTYHHEPIKGGIDPVVVLRNINCYTYQSDEHDGWETSQARAFCDSLTAACINVLPGYDEAPWGFTDRHYFTVNDLLAREAPRRRRTDRT